LTTYLLDTDMCIYIMNHRPPQVIRRCRQCEPGEIGISAVTISELRYGVSKSTQQKKKKVRLEEFLTPFEVLAYDLEAADVYGDIRFELKKKGTPVGALDLLIAAQALSRNLILVTNNEKEFQRIRKLKVENWTR
jgi:tRNA(fMet)-specific endonuclease VapC